MSFNIKIKDWEKLYHIAEGVELSLRICDISLDSLIQRTNIKLTSDGRNYRLDGFIIPFSDSNGSRKLRIPTKELSKEYKLKSFDSGIVVAGKEGNYEYGVYQDVNKEAISTVNVGFASHLPFLSRSKPLGSLDEFRSQVEYYFRLFSLIVNGIYRESNQKIPDKNMEVKLAIVLNQGLDKSNLYKKIEVEKPNVSLNDIGGLEQAKEEISGLITALRNPDCYKKWGTKPPKGVLIHGPEGTGKTLLAKALASETKAAFFHIIVSDIVEKWYGNPTKHMEEVFDIAEKNLPCILFLDELDALAPQRDGSHEETVRVVSTLEIKLDGLKSIENVIVLAATNRLDAIDKPLRRPGRFDRLIEVKNPNEKGREQIFAIHMRHAEELAERVLFKKVNKGILIEKSKNFSGADIAEIIRRVLEVKVKKEYKTNKEPCLVCTKDLVNEIDTYERKKKSRHPIGYKC